MEQLGVDPAPRHQLFMRAALGDPAILQHDYVIGVAHCGRAMAHHDRGAAAHALGQAVEHGAFGLGIDARKGVVEHHHRRIVDQHPRDRGALLLPARKRHPTFANDRSKAMRQHCDVGLETGHACGASDFVERGVSAAKRDIAGHRVREQRWLLRHHPDRFAQRAKRQTAQVTPVKRDASGGRLEQSGQQLDHRGFARPGAADDREFFPGGDFDRDIAQRVMAVAAIFAGPTPVVRVIAEPDVFPFDCAGHFKPRLAAFDRRRDRGEKDVVEPFHRGASTLINRNHPAQRRSRPHQLRQITHEGHQTADRHPMFSDQVTAVHQYHHHRGRVGAANERHQGAAQARERQALVIVAVIAAAEFLGFARVQRVGLYDVDAREAFLDFGADRAQLLLNAQTTLHQGLRKAANSEEQDHERDQRHEREAPLPGEHKAERIDVDQRRVGESQHAHPDHHPHRAQVVYHARHQVAGFQPFVEGAVE